MKTGLHAWVALVLALAASQGGCWFKRAPKAPPPPAVPAAKAEAPPPSPPKPKPLEEPQSPPVQLPKPEQEPTVIRPRLETPPPPKPAPAKRRTTPAPARPKAVEAPAQTVPAEAGGQAPAMTGPALGEVLSDSQRQNYHQTLDDNLAQAKRSLAGIRGRNLNREQSETAARVRTFIKQAEAAKGRDLGEAVQLSRRAALLARDLAESLR
ncbi:MAG: hypothetical protein HZB13_05185 [Acidobacteria bacterium]|nr:hypothetical protein [Acidobacteriota bacterium]